VDPLVPDGLWDALDERVRAHGRPVAVLTTLRWHRRSRDAVVRRYDATTSRARRSLPEDVETIPIRGAGETLVWLPRARALVVGDRIIGDGRGGLRLCPESWLRYLPSEMTVAGLREVLQPLLDLPVELVLTSHGDPVLEDGRKALARALTRA
jgi:glyoxylase-like metal-dependent hydrolase (beta-lactamase superfamily II)